MTLTDEITSMLPEKLSYDELGALIMIGKQLKSKSDSLKVRDQYFTKYLGFGRDKHDMVLSSLEKKGLINRTQQKNTEGKFTYNLVMITTDLITL